ncbi:hypothetical protein PMAYCL1PPCAC_15037, partial [Pristionchus mayeri]
MNSTELDSSIVKDLVYAQHICGVILLVFNSMIIILILSDSDMRNKHYRKYLCWVQISSLAFDTFSDFYAPIFMAHRGIIYSDSFLSNVIGVGSFMVAIMRVPARTTFQTIGFMFLGEVIISYFACVHYRRGV